jgi:adenine deaminase
VEDLNKIQTISGNIVDVLNSRIYPGTLQVREGRIVDITPEDTRYDTYLVPGFIDSHIHVESSMLVPAEFARIAVVHGTVACVSDPHEIANVLGLSGVKYMMESAEAVPLKFYFGAPSCVPATVFETSGAVIGPEEIERLLRLKEVKYLAEVMNFPGVINDDPGVLAKIRVAKKYSKPIDGHAPGLRGKDIERYVSAGISTDHESLSREEAIEKISLGMKVLIREGSAARDFDRLFRLLEDHYDDCMFCSDDKHPDDLIKGHINDMVKRAVDAGIDLMKVLKVACVNPVLHYNLDVGLLRKGDSADFLVVDSLTDFNVLRTYINGGVAAEYGRTLIPQSAPVRINNFHCSEKYAGDFVVPYSGGDIVVMEAFDGQLFTDTLFAKPKVESGRVLPDADKDILKIVVINRYRESKASIGFIKNFGIRDGAIASSIAHDSHNIVVVGSTDEHICRAVNLIIGNRGGISAVGAGKEMVLPLPVAGIMSDGDCYLVSERYAAITDMAKGLGSRLHAPFMTLSFMALLVIPKVKLSDMGLFDGERFAFINLFKET